MQALLVKHFRYFWNYSWMKTLLSIAPYTCIFPGTPVLSILLATLTVFPQMSYWGRRAPITPATTGPTLIPVQTRET